MSDSAERYEGRSRGVAPGRLITGHRLRLLAAIAGLAITALVGYTAFTGPEAAHEYGPPGPLALVAVEPGDSSEDRATESALGPAPTVAADAQAPTREPATASAPADVQEPKAHDAHDTDGRASETSVPILEDGRHAADLHALDLQGRTLTIDVVQFLMGQEAIDAYRRDHPHDPEGPPNDYYIVNVNPRLRTLPVAEHVAVGIVRLGEPSGTGLVPSTWEELPAHMAASSPDNGRLSWSPFWITVADGRITAIEEQYTP